MTCALLELRVGEKACNKGKSAVDALFRILVLLQCAKVTRCIINSRKYSLYYSLTFNSVSPLAVFCAYIRERWGAKTSTVYSRWFIGFILLRLLKTIWIPIRMSRCNILYSLNRYWIVTMHERSASQHVEECWGRERSKSRALMSLFSHSFDPVWCFSRPGIKQHQMEAWWQILQ